MEDYGALVSLWREAALPYKPEGRDSARNIRNEVRRDSSIFLVAEIDGRLVGSLLGSHDGRKGWINRLAVSPLYRRQGIAKRLVAEIEKRLSAQGIDIVAYLVEDENRESRQFIKSIGYEEHPDITYFTRRKNRET